jgi:hypothetical protein
MILGDFTIQNIQTWEDASDKALEVLYRWKAQIFKSDRPNKKDDLKEVEKIFRQIDLSGASMQSLFFELKKQSDLRKQDQDKIRKLQRYCRSLGGDPGLIYWHSDNDFV